MRNANNPQHKLSESQIEKARRLYEDDGWRVFWISVYFNINHRAIYFYVKSYGWVRRVKVTRYMPNEIAKIYRERKKQKNLAKAVTYDHVHQMSMEKEASDCIHVRWIKRCSLCGKILGSDATI